VAKSFSMLLEEIDPSVLASARESLHHARTLSSYTPASFPSGTDHSPQHTDAVDEHAGMLCAAGLIQELNDAERYLLLLACHFHDLGMVGTEEESATSAGQESIRRQHSVRIGERIKAEWQAFKLKSQPYAEALALTCRGHRPERDANGEPTWADLPELLTLGRNETVRPRLLSAILFAADELHIGDDRASHQVEQYREIRSKTAKVHWARHQAIRGPDLVAGQLRFSVQVDTPEQEEDLRRNVIRKAGQALWALQKEVTAHELNIALPRLVLTWNRDKCLCLCLWMQLMSLLAQSRDELESTLTTNYVAHVASCPDITDFASDTDSEERAIAAACKRIVSDAFSLGIVEAPAESKVQVRKDSQDVRKVIQAGMCEADASNVHFCISTAKTYSIALFESELGQYWIRHFVYPSVRATYSLQHTSTAFEDQVTTLLQVSPTACQLVETLSPARSLLAKPELLESLVMSGILMDLSDNSEIVLTPSVRHAFRLLATRVTMSLPQITYFIEEHALMRGFSFKEVTELLTEDFAKRPTQVAGGKHISMVEIADTPPAFPAIQSPYIIAASLRSRVGIALVGEPNKFDITVESDSDAESNASITSHSILITPQVGNGQLLFAHGRIRIDVVSRSMTFIAAEPGSAECEECPYFLRIDGMRQGAPSNFTIRSRLTHVTVVDALEVCKLRQLGDEGTVAFVIAHNETTLKLGQLATGTLKGLWESWGNQIEMLEKMVNLAPSLVLPCDDVDTNIGRETIDRCTNDPSLSLVPELKIQLSDREVVRSVVLRHYFSSEENSLFDEESLNFHDEESFSLPSMKCDAETLVKLQEEWDSV